MFPGFILSSHPWDCKSVPVNIIKSAASDKSFIYKNQLIKKCHSGRWTLVYWNVRYFSYEDISTGKSIVSKIYFSLTRLQLELWSSPLKLEYKTFEIEKNFNKTWFNTPTDIKLIIWLDGIRDWNYSLKILGTYHLRQSTWNNEPRLNIYELTDYYSLFKLQQFKTESSFFTCYDNFCWQMMVG